MNLLKSTEYQEVEQQCVRALSELTKLSHAHEALISRGCWQLISDYLSDRSATFQRFALRVLYNLARANSKLVQDSFLEPVASLTKSGDEWISALAEQTLDLLVPKHNVDQLQAEIASLRAERDAFAAQVVEQREDIGKLIQSSEMWQRSYQLAQDKLATMGQQADVLRQDSVRSEQEASRKWRDRCVALEQETVELNRVIADQRSDIGKLIESSEVWQQKYENLRALLDSVSLRPSKEYDDALATILGNSPDKRLKGQARVPLRTRVRESLVDIVNVLDAGIHGHQSLDLTYVCDASKILLQKIVYELDNQPSDSSGL
jgi:hypothetical protein